MSKQAGLTAARFRTERGTPKGGESAVATVSRGLIRPDNHQVSHYVDNNGNLIRKGVHENFLNYTDTHQVAVLAASGSAYGAASGTAGVINHVYTPGKNTFAWCPFVGQVLFPSIGSGGLNIACDLVDNDGCELASHAYGASGGAPFVIGNDAAFYFRCRLTIADVSGTDDLHVGFRRAEAFNATFDNYLDLASIGLVGATGDIQIETIDDNAATTTTDTTDNWTDGQTKTLEVRVSSSGVVTYKIDSAAPTTTAAFTFDPGDPVIPFVHFLHATTSPGAINIVSWDVDYQ